MSSSIKDKIVTCLTIAVLVLIVGGGVVMAYPNFVRSEELKRQNAELQEKIDHKRREIDELIEKQRRFKVDADFVEMIARQNRRVFPGELVFVFDKE